MRWFLNGKFNKYKYGKLSSFEIYNTFAIKRHIDWVNELLHDDFMYVQDYTMKTRDEAIEMVKEILALNSVSYTHLTLPTKA